MFSIYLINLLNKHTIGQIGISTELRGKKCNGVKETQAECFRFKRLFVLIIHYNAVQEKTTLISFELIRLDIKSRRGSIQFRPKNRIALSACKRCKNRFLASI